MNGVYINSYIKIILLLFYHKLKITYNFFNELFSTCCKHFGGKRLFPRVNHTDESHFEDLVIIVSMFSRRQGSFQSVDCSNSQFLTIILIHEPSQNIPPQLRTAEGRNMSRPTNTSLIHIILQLTSGNSGKLYRSQYQGFSFSTSFFIHLFHTTVFSLS